jgi:copper transport protein
LQGREAGALVPDRSVVGALGGVDEARATGVSTSTSRATIAEQDRATTLIAQQVKRREGRLSKSTQRLMRVLRWEPLLGVGVLICVGLMNVFGSTIPAKGAAQQQQQGTTVQSKPFQATVKTSDNRFLVTLSVNPNRFGTNVFTVMVVDSKTHKAVTNVDVALYTTMTDMDMGTQNVNLVPDGKGHFSASGDLTMAGNWEIRIQIRTTDHTLHEAVINLVTPF